MINIRQETKVVIELEGDQIETFAKLIGGLYEFNGSTGIGFQFKKKIKFDGDIEDMVEQFAYTLGLTEPEVEIEE